MPEPLWTDARIAALPSWSIIRASLVLAPRLAATLAPVGLTPTQFGVLVQLDNESVEESIAAGLAPSPVAQPLAIGPLASLAAFLLMTWASVAKPWGRTPWSAARPAARRPAPVVTG